MYRMLFNFNRLESVKNCINGLGKLSLQSILKIREVNSSCIYYTLLSLLSDLFWLHYCDYYSTSCCPRYAAVNAMY